MKCTNCGYETQPGREILRAMRNDTDRGRSRRRAFRRSCAACQRNRDHCTETGFAGVSLRHRIASCRRRRVSLRDRRASAVGAAASASATGSRPAVGAAASASATGSRPAVAPPPVRLVDHVAPRGRRYAQPRVCRDNDVPAGDDNGCAAGAGAMPPVSPSGKTIGIIAGTVAGLVVLGVVGYFGYRTLFPTIPPAASQAATCLHRLRLHRPPAPPRRS